MLIKEITFYLENCDYIKIPGMYIGSFIVSDIRKEIARLACNAIDEINIVHDFAIEISSAANEDYREFGQFELRSKFDRLKENDITQIEFVLYDQYDRKIPEKRYYSLIWGEDDYTNTFSETYISDLNNLYIVVSDNHFFWDFFDKKIINNHDLINFAFDMYDVPYGKEEK